MSNWKEIKLRDFVKLSKNFWKPNQNNKSVPYIGLEHIAAEELRLCGKGDSKNVLSNKHKFKMGDTLFGKLRPYLKKIAKPNFSGICSTDIWVIAPKADASKDFVFYFFANDKIINDACASSGGTRMPRANWDTLSKTSWKIPEIEEQKKIAAVLSKIQEAIEAKDNQKKNLEELFKTMLDKLMMGTIRVHDLDIDTSKIE